MACCLQQLNNGSLTRLNLGRNNMGNEGACQMAAMLSTNTSLLQLATSWNTISNSDTHDLAEVLRFHRRWTWVTTASPQRTPPTLRVHST